MSKPLEILPEHLLSASGALTESYSAATEKVTRAFATAVPVPAGADSVSFEAAGAFQKLVPKVQETLADALVKVGNAAQTMVPIAQSYMTTDQDGGALLKVAADGLGKLTETLATTLPQIAQAAASTEEDGGAAALITDHDDRGEVSAQRSTFA